MARELDLAWEALVRETQANPDMERGALNKALRAIRAACRQEGIVDVAEEIVLRCEGYRRTFPGITLTPNALAKHWFRVLAPPQRSPQQQQMDRLRRGG